MDWQGSSDGASRYPRRLVIRGCEPLSGEASGCQIAEGGAAIAAVGIVKLPLGNGSILVEEDAGRAEMVASLPSRRSKAEPRIGKETRIGHQGIGTAR